MSEGEGPLRLKQPMTISSTTAQLFDMYTQRMRWWTAQQPFDEVIGVSEDRRTPIPFSFTLTRLRLHLAIFEV